MRVVTAQLAGGERSADRVFVSDDAVVVLDGATSFEPVELDPGEYADSIGREIVRRLRGASIPDAVSGAIASTAQTYDLAIGRSPSSTVSVLRLQDNVVDLYVLGDSSIHYGTGSDMHQLNDTRLEGVATTERANYMRALKAGRGYTSEHWMDLALLQQEQRRYRNQHNGYWIAEAEPDAAYYGLLRSLSTEHVSWAVLATDGVEVGPFLSGPRTYLAASKMTDDELNHLLHSIHEWEALVDPHGMLWPRAKCHDDKTIATVKIGTGEYENEH